MAELVMVSIAVCMIFANCFAMTAAYRNGVTDGYGYAREPRNPGYKKAGLYLKKTMAHRWRELMHTDESIYNA